MTKVKICGLTRLGDALQADNLKADFLGFNFYPKSPRYFSPEKYMGIRDNLPSGPKKVGVFVNQPLEEVAAIRDQLRLDYLQLHGDESPDYCKRLGGNIIKAIRVADLKDIEMMQNYQVPLYLLDTKNEGLYGGTGDTFDWELALKAKQYGEFFVAGGLSPFNIKLAIRKIEPFGVDVCGGVEGEIGYKNYTKMADFIKRAKNPQTVKR